MTWEPLSSFYRVELLDVEKRVGAVVLPDTAVDPSTDAVVWDLGPGRLQADGTRSGMQARIGDRIVVQEHDLQRYDRRHAFVRDEHLVALLPAPYHAEDLRPAGDYVLVRPEPLERFETRASGVIVAGYSLYGGEARSLERGEALLREIKAWGQRVKLSERSAEDQLRAIAQWLEPIPFEDRLAMRDAMDEDGDTGWESFLPPVRREPPRRGLLEAVGSGASAQRLSGLVGETVRWEKHFRGVSLYPDGQERLFLPASALMAVEP